jgi:hypothetical protein
MFRFTIRDVLWLTALVALGVGWWIHARAMSAEILSLRRQLDFTKYERSLDAN